VDKVSGLKAQECADQVDPDHKVAHHVQVDKVSGLKAQECADQVDPDHKVAHHVQVEVQGLADLLQVAHLR
jgi:hypothetical protein